MTKPDKEWRESAQKYQALFEQSIDGIYVHDLDGTIIDINAAALAQSGFTKEELVGRSVFDHLPEEISPDEIVEEWRGWQPSSSVVIEGSHQRKDGTTYPVEINTGKILVGDRELMLAIVRDITDRKKVEEERAALEERLRHSQKMEAVGRLAGGVAHDFNNVLCAITGNVELALRDLDPAHQARKSLEAALVAVAQATSVTRKLLAFSRKEVVEPRLVDLNAIVEGIIPMLSHLLGEHIVVRVVADEQLGLVHIDPGQVEQILVNLAVNARDAMAEGGSLVLETANVTIDEAYCQVRAGARPGDYVMLGVGDTGTGMDAETRSKIFEPFFTTKREGTGLGLATTYGIVEQNAGLIEVYSEPGQGTVFKVLLPRGAGEAAALDRGRGLPAAPRGDAETVLVVEDEEIVRDVASRILKQCGYRVLTAASGGEALEISQQLDGRIHLLLTDVVMPGMNGRELAARLTEHRPDIKVLFASGHSENVIAHHGVLDEGVELIAKPYSMDALALRVRAVLDGGQEDD